MARNIYARALLAVVAAGAFTGGGWALGQSTQTVPPAFDAAAGTIVNSLPIGNYTAGVHQVIYGADQMAAIPPGSVITGMQMRLAKTASTTFPAAPVTITRYDITFAASTLTPATMSATFASNMSSPVLVRSGAFNLVAGAYQWLNNGAGVPEPWGPLIPFATNYVYAGGPLVIQMRVASPSSNFNAYADIGNTASARYMYQDNNADAVTAATQAPTNGGLVVRLTFIPPVPDLAKGVTKVIVGEAYVGASGPSSDGVLVWSLPFTQQAVAAVNQFDTMGPGSDFVGMAMRLGNSQPFWPTAVANFSQYDVQLSRSLNAPGSLSTTVASNVGADAVAVRSGALSLPIGYFGIRGSEATAPFAAELSFANRYTYRGGPLLSVVRHSGQGTGIVTFLDSIPNGSAVQSFQTNSNIAAVVGNGSNYAVTRYSVDAGTISPLDLLAPGASNLGANFLPQALQWVISASELKYIPVGSVIDSLWLRQSIAEAAGPGDSVTAADFDVDLSSAPQQPEFMSGTFAANEGADKVRVHDGAWALAAGALPAGSNGNFGKLVQFQKNFVYKGGPLCITIRHSGLSGPYRGWEALLGSLAINKAKYTTDPAATEGFDLGSGFDGIATKLGYIPSVITPNNMVTQSGGAGPAWLLPQNATATVQVIIAADQLRSMDVGAAITGMSFRNVGAATFPAVDTNLTRFDVTMAPAANSPLSMSSTFASNNGPGVVTVRSGAMTVPAGAYPQAASGVTENAWYVPFSRAYVYTGGDLCVTIRSEGILSSTGIFDGDGFSPSARGASRWNYFTGGANAATGSSWGPMAIRFAFTARAFCPWDLNNDGVVSDDDFPIFLSAYNTLDCADGAMPQGCPADFNFDRVVNDGDFELFIGAYNELLCP